MNPLTPPQFIKLSLPTLHGRGWSVHVPRAGLPAPRLDLVIRRVNEGVYDKSYQADLCGRDFPT